MSIKRRLFRFTKTASTMDLRTTAQEQRIADIKRKAARFETLKHTAGISSDFGAEIIREDIHYMQMARSMPILSHYIHYPY